MKTNSEVRYAAHPDDVKHYDTEKLRENYLIGKVFSADEVNLVYTMHDRMIAGGAMPVEEIVELQPIDILRNGYFLGRREIGIFNVGGEGIVKAGDSTYRMAYKEALYLGKGDRKVTFESVDKANPAKFYFCSTPAHTTYPDHLTTRDEAVKMELGTLEESNHRVINRMLVKEVVPSCQLQMGMTELKPGSTWNTMPAHTHNRRMEVYFYFEIPDDQAICHFMGQPDETRHIWMKNGQAVISPEWSIHSACATKNYTFIWAMGGENLDYGDMDGCATTDLK
ncbi:MAG: 5-dehydro-4-deoxy-D-glucuronate isomerase [Clostridium sp.]|nr:5-dehydro-4-deoxy-D-glucuronate isomerase [Bacteroides sp.]MCM1197338.1 5-dehydro-4-deoxy-D-glucuronate isomerase [Clostridium sp.]